MISFRSLLVLLPLLALGACDNAPAPPIEPVKPPQPKVIAPAVAPAPVVSAPVIAPAAKPLVKQAREPATPSPAPKPDIASKPVVKSKPDASVAKAPIPAPKLELELDLSLPPEMLEPTESLETFSELPTALLPPLFDEQSGPRTPFQLQGKLITNERGDQGYWDSLEGAELQFEFKR